MLENAPTLRIFVLLCALFVSGCASSAPPEASEPVGLGEPASVLEGERYLEYRVGVHIEATPEAVWAVLEDASRYPEWNSTVTRLDGEIVEGGALELHSTVDPSRSFELEVSAVEPQRGMVWSDGGRSFRGVRTFELAAREDGTTDFTMREVFTGTMMGMIAPKLPDFRPSFDSFAGDLKRAALALGTPAAE